MRPSSSVGATVTCEPFTVTFRKWNTRAAASGTGAAPHFEPLDFVGDHPIAYASHELQPTSPIGSSVPPPPPVT